MEITQEIKRRVVYHLYLGYILSGALITIFGAVLPFLIAEEKLNYSVAGGLISMLAIGNFSASILYPMAKRFLTHRRIVLSVTVLSPFIMLLLTIHPPIPVMYALVFLLGLTKGTITMINNLAMNIVTHSSTKYLNILHTTYAIGAFTSPFIMAALLALGFPWRSILYILCVCAILFPLTYGTMDYRLVDVSNAGRAAQGSTQKTAAAGSSGVHSLLTNVSFLLVTFIMFMYLGFENTVNGWFVTYLQDTGVMSSALATVMVSVTWVMMMLGRMGTAQFLRDVGKLQIILASALIDFIAIVLLVNTHTAMMAAVVITILGLGMSAIYPTTIAAAGPIIEGSTIGLSLLTGISAVGGFLVPEIIGLLADRLGIVSAMGTVVLTVGIMLLLSVWALLREKKRT